MQAEEKKAKLVPDTVQPLEPTLKLQAKLKQALKESSKTGNANGTRRQRAGKSMPSIPKAVSKLEP